MRVIVDRANLIKKYVVISSFVFQNLRDCNFTDLLLHLFEHNSFVIYVILHIDINDL